MIIETFVMLRSLDNVASEVSGLVHFVTYTVQGKISKMGWCKEREQLRKNTADR